MPPFFAEWLLDITRCLAAAAAMTLLLRVMASMAGGHIGWSPTFAIVFTAIYASVLVIKFDLLG